LAANTGEQRASLPIVPDGPESLTATLPLAEMLDALEQCNVNAVISDDAGGYVCNHVFYTARHVIESESLPIRCGFIHVPLNAEQIVDAEAQQHATSLATLVEAVDRCLRVIAAERQPAGGTLC